MQTIKEKIALLHPSYWLVWIGLGGLWLITRLPYSVQMAIGRLLGMGLYYLPSKLKSITQVNIALCFPERAPAEQTRLVKENFASLGMGLIETAMAWWLPDEKLKQLLSISGMEYLQQAFQKNRGIILLSPHFTCLELIGRAISLQYTFTAMYRPHKNRLIAYIQERFRNKKTHYIPRHKIRLLFESLKKNEAVWYAYDVDGGTKRSVFAPFFGIPTASLTSVSRIAATTSASVVPVRFYRRNDHPGYEIIFSPPLADFPSNDYLKDATRLNAILEKAIREKPEQYIWQYKRFKTRPKGEERFYS